MLLVTSVNGLRYSDKNFKDDRTRQNHNVDKMIKSENSFHSADTTIEDIIDARKNLGQYDVCTQVTNTCRYAYSAPSATINDLRIGRNACNVWMSDGELTNHPFDVNTLNVGATDSEITVVRVKREGLQFKTCRNNWDMHDEAIPGDGTHLGESPSLVNLVTLVAGQSETALNSVNNQRDEYLVPLSSWDPSDNPHEFQDIQETMEADCPVMKTTISRRDVLDGECNTELHVIKAPDGENKKRSLAKRIVNFFRLRFGRPKTLPSRESEVRASVDKM